MSSAVMMSRLSTFGAWAWRGAAAPSRTPTASHQEERRRLRIMGWVSVQVDREAGKARQGSRLRPGSFGLDVVAQKDVVVAQVKTAAGDHGMGPGVELAAAHLGEASGFLVGGGRG